nr:flavin reductase [uncultured Merdimonas sp.]
MAFQEKDIHTLNFNPFDKISKQWMLITAGDQNGSNTMTASWGGVGIMWGKPVATAYIRPQRYTKEFVDQNEYFTLSFLPEEYRSALNICGSVSGRDVEDKWKEAGLHPCFVNEGTADEVAAVEEAEMIFVCRKLYAQEMHPEYFTENECDAKWYPQKDYHTMYIAEIVKVLVK